MDISEINIIRNEQGMSNVASFKKSLPSTKTDASPKARPAKPQQARRPNYLIDRLELSLGKVAYIDHSASVGEPAAIIFTVEGPFVHQNVTSLTKVAESVSVKGGFKNLLNNLLGSVAKNDIIKSTGERIKDSLKRE